MQNPPGVPKKWPKWFFLLLSNFFKSDKDWLVVFLFEVQNWYLPWWWCILWEDPELMGLTLHCPCNLVTFACVLPVYHCFMKPRVQWIIQTPLYEVFNASTNVSSNWRYHQETSGTCGYSVTNQGKTMWDKMFISKLIYVWGIITFEIMLFDVFGVILRL